MPNAATGTDSVGRCAKFAHLHCRRQLTRAAALRWAAAAAAHRKPPAAAGSIRGSSISAGRAPKNKKKSGNRAAHLDPRAEGAAVQQQRNLVSSRRNPFPGPEGQGRRCSCAPVSVDPNRTEVGAGLEKRNPPSLPVTTGPRSEVPPLLLPAAEARNLLAAADEPRRSRSLEVAHIATTQQEPHLAAAATGTLRVPLRETPLPPHRPAQWATLGSNGGTRR